VLTCCGIKKKMANTLHADVKSAVSVYLNKNLPVDFEVKNGEPQLAGHWQRKGPAPVAPIAGAQAARLPPGERGDIGVGRQNIEKPVWVIDVTLTSPINMAVPVAQRGTQGAAALVAYQKKVKVYDDMWHGIKSHLIPFAVEHGGFINPNSWRRLTDLVRPRFITVVNGQPTLDPQFHRQNRFLREKIQNLVQSSVARFTHNLDGYARDNMAQRLPADPPVGDGHLGHHPYHVPLPVHVGPDAP
jgi:hypothetical protein